MLAQREEVYSAPFKRILCRVDLESVMQTELHSGDKPFVLALADKPDHIGYSEAVRLADLLKDSYDPESQTSRAPAHAGTLLTYCETGTGISIFPDRDHRDDDP